MRTRLFSKSVPLSCDSKRHWQRLLAPPSFSKGAFVDVLEITDVPYDITVDGRGLSLTLQGSNDVLASAFKRCPIFMDGYQEGTNLSVHLKVFQVWVGNLNSVS